VARPSRNVDETPLPQRAIGYGVQASPLHVARAYAAFATGCLPTVGFRPEARPRVALDDVASELATVQQGLRACVQHGTARALPLLNELGCCGKTGTAEVSGKRDNNAWFAGYLPPAGSEGAQLCFCAVVYFVKDGVHGGDVAGQLVVDFLSDVQANADAHRRWLAPEGGR
jgi:cell division protein FtsI/penicillin-binding protein 2